MDETMFGGKRPGKRGWGASGKCLLFPSLPGLKRPCNPYIKRYTKAGSLYYADDWFPFYLFEEIMWSY